MGQAVLGARAARPPAPGSGAAAVPPGPPPPPGFCRSTAFHGSHKASGRPRRQPGGVVPAAEGEERASGKCGGGRLHIAELRREEELRRGDAESVARRRAAQRDSSPPPHAGLPLQHSTAPPHWHYPAGAGGTPPRLPQPRGGESLPQDTAGGCKLSLHALHCKECAPPRAPPRSPRGWPCPGAQSSEAAASRASSHRPPLPIAATAAGKGRCPSHRARPPYMLSHRPQPAPPRRG